MVVRTAASCAASTSRDTSGAASAHSADTDFTGLKVRSYPAATSTRPRRSRSALCRRAGRGRASGRMRER